MLHERLSLISRFLYLYHLEGLENYLILKTHYYLGGASKQRMSGRFMAVGVWEDQSPTVAHSGIRYPRIWIALIVATRLNARLLGLQNSANLSQFSKYFRSVM